MTFLPDTVYKWKHYLRYMCHLNTALERSCTGKDICGPRGTQRTPIDLPESTVPVDMHLEENRWDICNRQGRENMLNFPLSCSSLQNTFLSQLMNTLSKKDK